MWAWLIVAATQQASGSSTVVFNTGHKITITAMVVGWVIQFAVYMYRRGKHDKDIDTRFEKHGERIGAMERGKATNTTRIDELAKKTQQMEFQVSELYKDFGDTRGSIESLVRTIETQSERRRVEEKEIIERLATIETQLTFLVRGRINNHKE